MCRTYHMVQNILANKSESQAHEELNKCVNQSKVALEEVTIGLIVSVLVEPNNAPRVSFLLRFSCVLGLTGMFSPLQYYRDLIHINRDGMVIFNYNINHIITEKYFRMHDHSRKQVLILTAKFSFHPY